MEVSEININDANYPTILREMVDAPDQIFVWGDVNILSQPSVAIVGTRKPTDYGIRSSAHLARGLAKSVVVVSGLAYGVDTIALTEALEAGGKVVGVIGSGLDRDSFYPATNWGLAQKIVEQGGAVISEYPAGTPPLKHHFVARNRIIAGLTLGTVVVEAPKGSGALITADFALDANREVLAVAGSMLSVNGVGTNKLIKNGAAMVTSPRDILDELNLEDKTRLQPTLGSAVGGSPEEIVIIKLLGVKSQSADEIAKSAKLDAAKVGSTLTLMEVKGTVKNIGAGKFALMS